MVRGRVTDTRRSGPSRCVEVDHLADPGQFSCQDRRWSQARLTLNKVAYIHWILQRHFLTDYMLSYQRPLAGALGLTALSPSLVHPAYKGPGSRATRRASWIVSSQKVQSTRLHTISLHTKV